MHMTNRREKAPDRAVSEGRILVAGAGTMGYGIAAACALGGFQVVMTSRRKESLDKGLSNARRDLSQMAKDGLITREEAAAALERIQVSTDLSAGRSAAFVLETITEDLAAKQELLSQLDKLCPPETIFASDTSTLSIAGTGEGHKEAGPRHWASFFHPRTDSETGGSHPQRRYLGRDVFLAPAAWQGSWEKQLSRPRTGPVLL